MSDLQQSYSITRTTGTHADVFAAVGLARLLASSGRPVRITEESTGFGVKIEGVGEGLLNLTAAPGYPFLKTNEKIAVPHSASDPVDYKAEKAKADRIRTLRKGKKLKALDAATLEAIEQEKPRPDWRLLQVLNSLQGDETSNRVHEMIVKLTTPEFREMVAGALRALAQNKPSSFDWRATSVQLFTPISAKGYSRLKPDSTDRNDKTKDQWTDPFIEWLRYQGYFAVGCPFFQGSKSEHVRLLCPIPHDISIAALVSAAHKLRETWLPGDAAKLDSLAVLKLAEILIEHSTEYHADDVDPFDDFPLAGRSPADAISGITITHYQSLGNAKAVSAMSTIALPGWFHLDSSDDAALMLDILAEHQMIIRSLQDDHSDEIGMLIAYRRFLQARGEPALQMLIEFMGAYGSLLLRAWQQGRRLRAFRAENFRRILMATTPKLTEVLDNPGFQAVANALRRATVSAQFLRANNREHREIRYGLFAELRRKRELPGNRPLIEAVSEFIQSYNSENARQSEVLRTNAGKKSWHPPSQVGTEEFAAFVALVEVFGASTVGAMLCAYGSCRDRDPESPEIPSETEETGENN